MSRHAVSLTELEAVHRKVAVLAADHPAYLPVFARLEAELVLARVKDDPVAKARAMLAHQSAVA